MKNEEIAEGVQLIPEGISIPTLSILSGNFGESKLQEYAEKIKRYDEKARETLNVFSFVDGKVKGSNVFADVELASGIIALSSELEHAVRISPGYFRGTYEDIGLVLRTEGDSYQYNDYLAKNLAEQVKKRGVALPARISLKGLTLKEDGNSSYGLVFLLGEDSEVINVPEFSYVNNRKSFSRSDERGIPIFDGNGNRIFYSRENGLSRLYLNVNLNLNSNDEYLADSDAYGRVVVVSGEAAGADILQEYLLRISANLSELRNRLNARHLGEREEVDNLAKKLGLELELK